MSGGIRRRIGPVKARIRTQIDELLQIVAQPLNNENLQLQREEIADHRDRLENHVTSLDQSITAWDNYLLTLNGQERLDEDNLYGEHAEGDFGFIEISLTGHELLTRLQTRIQNIDRRANQIHNNLQHQNPLGNPEHLNGNPNQHNRIGNDVKLPKLQLPQFDGDHLKWKEFWDIFDSSVNQQNIPAIQKFNYLKSCLKGSAETAIKGIAISNDNYDVVIRILRDRFGDESLIKTALYNEFLNIEPAGSRNFEVRKTVDRVDQILNQLEALGENINQALLVPGILKKFPVSVVSEIEKAKDPNVQWTVNDLRLKLKNYIKVRENSEKLAHNGVEKSKVPNYSVPKMPVRFMSAESLAASQKVNEKPNESRSSNQKSNTTICTFCQNTHYADQCPNFPNFESRRKRSAELKCCYLCLKPGHRLKECFLKSKMYCKHCKAIGQHHSALCSKNEKCRQNNAAISVTHNREMTTANKFEKTAPGPSTIGQTLLSTNEQVLMHTATAQVQNPKNGNLEIVKILFDSGSVRTFVTKSLQKKLQLNPVSKDFLSISVFATEASNNFESDVVEIELKLKDCTNMTLQANTVEKITNPILKHPMQKEDLEFLNLISLENFADNIAKNIEYYDVDILIGSDYFWQIIEGSKTILPSGLFMVSSKLGLIITGRYFGSTDLAKTDSSLLCFTPVNQTLSELSLFSKTEISSSAPNLEDFWNLETVGIKDSPYVVDDDIALQKFNETVKFKNDRYEVEWPWKLNESELPDNFEVAFRRLQSLSHRLNNDDQLKLQYNEIIQNQLKLGVIEKVTEETETGSRMHYLPHHPVITPLKNTTKIRIVYDASAKSKRNDPSLNDCLYRGPVLLPDLCGLLLRFRLDPIILLADIEKAFLQIQLKDTERDVTRFLWIRNLDSPEVSGNIEIYRFCRVPFGIISSPFLLEATLKHHLSKNQSPVASKISENIYVDNVMLGANNIHEAFEMYETAVKIFKDMSMNLREWTTNDEELLEMVPENQKVRNQRAKFLGLTWKLKEDTIEVNTGKSEDLQSVSKRSTVQSLAQVFDPLGLFAPVTLNGKLFLQKLWKLKKSWDEKLELSLVEEWQSIKNELMKISSIKVPRFVGMNENELKFELVVFCDASVVAYATVGYLCIKEENRPDKKCELMFAKSRLAPLRLKSNKQEVSVPRLELIAVESGVKTIKFLKEQLKIPIEKQILYTDSQCVLNWLKTKKVLSTFVENRVKRIKEPKDIIFSYVPSNENPADIATRKGTTTSDLKEMRKWWHGPEWLQKSEKDFTENAYSLTPEVAERIENEVKGSKIACEVTLLEEKTECQTLLQIKIERFSTLKRLLRVTAYCLKFLKVKIWNKLSNKLQERLSEKHKWLKNAMSEINCEGGLKYKEITVAKILWERVVQRQHFRDVFVALENGKKHNLVAQLGLKIDENGILRCHGRFDHAKLPQKQKFPKLLPRNEKYTLLLITQVHERLFHAGIGHTLTQCREEYWILKGRVEVRKVIAKCLTCKRHEGPPFSLPVMPPWPEERVSTSLPFQFIGLDYLGPILVKEGNDTIKMWICLLTCLSTRAIHLEWVKGLSAKEFLDCFRRFIGRRGKPDLVISDNAPQLKLVKKTCDKVWLNVVKDLAVTDYVANECIQWKFITEFAPWQGGFYERLVGIVKRSLRKAIGQKRLTWNSFATLIVEIEGIVNTRPLTFIYSDFDSGFVLTPSHFLARNRKIGVPTLETDYDNEEFEIIKRDPRQNLISQWKNDQKLLEIFWRAWKKEYLASLREKLPIYHKNPRSIILRNPVLHEIVLLKENGLSRNAWRIGKIESLLRGKDKNVRSAVVKLQNKRNVVRPLNLLYPLEISSVVSNDKEILNESKTN